jgi:uncharacterized protein (DUF2252 family)
MNEAAQLFERHAEWQRNRCRLSWPEKMRMAEALRETLCRFRSLRAGQQESEQEKVKR